MMTFKDRQAKAKELKQLIGEHVEITLKSLAIIDVITMDGDSKLQISNIIQGYIIDVTPYYLYIGPNMENGYTDMLDLEEVGRFGLIDVNMKDMIDVVEGEVAH